MSTLQSQGKTELSVMVVDSQQLIRMALSKLLSSNGIQIVGSAPDAISALRMNLRFRPKIAVIDILLKEGPNGIELAQELRKMNSRIGIVFLTTLEDLRTIGSVTAEMPIGSIYLNKADVNDVEQIRDAIRRASKNTLSVLFSVTSEPKLRSQPFTDNQMDLMRMISQGMSNKSISSKRFTTEKSTENAISRLAKKMNMPSDILSNQRVSIAQFFYAINS
jgi:DNA-binding NarL/FixJ family response regulator